ncbi:energy transducer TonB [Candidatus Hepatincola sp. Av]
MVKNNFINWNRCLLISLWIHLLGISFYFHEKHSFISTIDFHSQVSSSANESKILAIKFQKSVVHQSLVKPASATKKNVGINKKAPNSTTVIAKNPTFAKQTPLYYPPRAIELGIMGTISLRALVNKAGDIQKIVIIKSSNYKILDEATLKTVSKWKINPIVRNNVRIGGWVEFSVNYNLKNT